MGPAAGPAAAEGRGPAWGTERDAAAGGGEGEGAVVRSGDSRLTGPEAAAGLAGGARRRGGFPRDADDTVLPALGDLSLGGGGGGGACSGAGAVRGARWSHWSPGTAATSLPHPWGAEGAGRRTAQSCRAPDSGGAGEGRRASEAQGAGPRPWPGAGRPAGLPVAPRTWRSNRPPPSPRD